MANCWTLKAVSGVRAGESFALKSETTTIGRKKGDIVLRKDAELSGQHAEFKVDRGTNTVTLVDLDSRNGCRVNGQRVKTQRLQPGDKIRIGTTDFVLEAATAAAPPVVKVVAASAAGPDITHSEHPPIHGFLQTVARLFFAPKKFFQGVAAQKNVGHSIRFAATSWFAGCVLAAVLSVTLALMLRMSYDLKSVVAIVVAGLSSLLLIPLLVPISAVLFHFTSRIFRGHASFGKALQIACYSTAFTFSACILDLVPKIGKYLSLLPFAYGVYVLAAASVTVYGVRRWRAYAVWGIIGSLALCGVFISQEHASRTKNAFFAAQVNANPVEVVFILKETYHDAVKDAVVGNGEQRQPAGN